MRIRKPLALLAAGSLALGGLAACSSPDTADSGTAASNSATETAEAAVASTNLPQIDMGAWLYDADSDVYYQTGISYAETPATDQETLGIYVPGAYMKATDNGDGTYTCELTDAEVGGYTAQTAPIVLPVNTPGYSAQSAPTGFESQATTYTDAGFVYVVAGARGRDEGAPAGVTDFKAAIRYLRYNDGVIPGSTEAIFPFGHSGGGAQSAILGASGDSDLYDPYLEEIGAVQGVSDAVAGVMAWCPITNLDQANEAYEWNMGSSREGLSEEEQGYSDAMAETYAAYINAAGITDAEGNTLTLEESDEGVYQAGSYYEYIKSVIEESLNTFLATTEFPYDASASNSGGMGGMPGGGAPGGGGPGGDSAGGPPSGEAPDGAGPQGANGQAGAPEASQDTSMADAEARDGVNRTGSSTSLDLSGTYESAQAYVDALNAESQWVTYDADTNTATITSVADFVKYLKSASKSLGAFDAFDASQTENTLFGYGDGNGAHFDANLYEILAGTEYEEAIAADLDKEDSVGNTVATRLAMYTPLYYLLESEEGYGTSTLAKNWRIRTGINQGDTALSTEANLALAAAAAGADVDFATVWGQGHTQAETEGNASDNFISWVNEVMAG